MSPADLKKLTYDLSYKLGLWSNSLFENNLREFVDQLLAHIDLQAAQIAALKEIVVMEKAKAIRTESYDQMEGIYRIGLPDATDMALQQLEAEHPEAMR